MKSFLVALFSSVAGGVFGFWLGKKFGQKIFKKLFGKKWLTKIEKFLKKWGIVGVFLCAFSPIPFKIAAWGAGIFKMPLSKFIIASFLGRGMRFAISTFGIEFILSFFQ